MTPERYDVIVVGARCAGSSLATLLARRGLRVAVLERTTFPSDTLSSHLFETDALAFLDRLGLTEGLRATGAPVVDRTDTRVEDLYLDIPLPQQPGDVGGMMSVRRFLLDPLLAHAAQESGAELLMGAEVTALLREREHGHERERVTGVRVRLREGRDGDRGNGENGHGENGHGENVGAHGERGGQRERDLHARLVVGADGRHSTVAKLCGARRYNVTPNRRLLYWGFYEGADAGARPTFLSHRWQDRFILGIPSDGGLYQVLVWPEKAELDAFRADPQAALLQHARVCEPLTDTLAGAHQVGKTLGAVSWEGFFREAAGPGWVLTGDAGHFKSPSPGRGIGDAFIQAERLAAAIAGALGGSEAEMAGALGGSEGAIDAAMRDWGRWRDREFAEHYWLAYDLEDAGAVPAVLVELLRGLQRRERAGLFFDLLNHRVRPTQVLTPPRLLGATTRLLAGGRVKRGALLSELGTLGGQELRRRRLNRRPAYATA
jgi:flavin-dependent dehydrogenase